MDKTELLMNLKNRTLSTEIEYYQDIRNIFKKILSAFQIIVAIFKINSIDFSFFFIWRFSRICSRSLPISCAIIEVFSTRIFRNPDLRIELFLICKAMELESLRCIVTRLERVVVVRPTYALFSLETQSPKGYLNIYMTLVLSISSVELMAYEESESARDNFGKFIDQFQPEIKTLRNSKGS